jgi:hypothetical protein
LGYRSYFGTDNASNSEEGAIVDVFIDHTAPAISFLTTSGMTFTTGSVQIPWAIADTSGGGATLVYFDGRELASYQRNVTVVELSKLSDGTHTMNVTITDLAGNVGAGSVTFRINTDPLSPEGPMGIWLLLVLVVAAASLTVVAILTRRRARRG